MGATLALAATFTAVGVLGRPPSAAAAETLEPFDDCAALGAWSRELLEPLVGAYGLGGGGVAIDVGVARASAGAAESAAAPQAAGDSAGGAEVATESAVGPGTTGTNLQEAGVDEPDIVKTDGRLLYTTVGADLVVVDVAEAQPRRLGSVEVPAMRWANEQSDEGFGLFGTTDVAVPEIAVDPGVVGSRSVGTGSVDTVPATAGGAELLLVGSRVVVLSTSWYTQPLDRSDRPQDGDGDGDGTTRPGLTRDDDASAEDERVVAPGAPMAPVVSTTTATVLDVSDPAAPRVLTTTELEGGYVSAREVGDVVRLVVQSSPVLPFVASTSTEFDSTGQVVDDDALETNRAVLRDAAGADFLPHRVSRDDAGQVTAREPALDCGAVSHPVEPAGVGTVTVATLDVDAEAGDTVVDAVGVSADGSLVYASEDRLYVATTTGGWSFAGTSGSDEMRTALHGFDVSDPARTTYLASGDVEGYLLGRWALSARDGFLRVATTRGDVFGGGSSDSAVTVLAERAGVLETVGEVDGLGLGEQIRAVRWFDDSAVVVTFRQTDPLYLVDLSDPVAPALTGELKVPGYSAYLHPVGEQRMLGVGQDATDEGQTTGVQVSSFDLSDPAAPSRTDALTERDSYSDVEGDARLFTYLPERRVALLPISGPAGSSLRAVRLDDAGALAEVGAYYPQASPQQFAYLQRAVAVGGDRVAVMVADDDGPSVTLLALDDLTEVGTVSLG